MTAAARNRLRDWFGWPSVVSAVVAVVSVAVLHLYLKQIEEDNAERLRMVKNEIRKLDAETEEIRKLPDLVVAVLARKQILKALQRDRLHALRLVEEVARRRPAGTYLTYLGLERETAYIEGYAASEQAVKTFIEGVAASPYLQTPQSQQVRAVESGGRQQVSFSFETAMHRNLLGTSDEAKDLWPGDRVLDRAGARLCGRSRSAVGQSR